MFVFVHLGAAILNVTSTEAAAFDDSIDADDEASSGKTISSENEELQQTITAISKGYFHQHKQRDAGDTKSTFSKPLSKGL